MNRHKPMQFGVKPKPKPSAHAFDSDEEFARMMQERHDWIARFLGICPVCAEYKHRFEDGSLRCVVCPSDPVEEAINTF